MGRGVSEAPARLVREQTQTHGMGLFRAVKLYVSSKPWQP